MGETITTDSAGNERNDFRKERERKRQEREGKISASSSAAAAKTEGRTEANNRRTEGEGKDKKVVSEMAIITENVSHETDKKSTENDSKSVDKELEKTKQDKPKRTRKTKDKGVNDVALINSFLMGVSSVVASREGWEHWQIDEKESLSISTPLSAILAEHEVFRKLGEKSNEIALATACMSVILPRAIMSINIQKEKQKKEKEVGQIGKQRVETVSTGNIRKGTTGQTETGTKKVSAENNKQFTRGNAADGNIDIKDAEFFNSIEI